MPFYVADYLADTMHLTAAEHGGYLMLILHYWKSGPIPDDDSRLATISRMGDAWSNASSTLRAFFKQQDGMLVHSRIDREKSDALDNKSRNKARAVTAANKRWGNDASSNATSMPQAMLDECPSPSPSPSLKTKPNSKASATATRLPEDWIPSDLEIEFLKSERPELNLNFVADRYRDYWISQPGNKGKKVDWLATWRNWVRNESVPRNQPQAKPEKFDPVAYVNRNRKPQNDNIIDINEFPERL